MRNTDAVFNVGYLIIAIFNNSHRHWREMNVRARAASSILHLSLSHRARFSFVFFSFLIF